MNALRQRPLVLDAGMGTRLIELGLNVRDDDPSLWTLTHAPDILAIHRRDLAAGAVAILTNTFGANRCWMSRFGREAEVETINRRAVELARLSVRAGHWVIGDIGPTAAAQTGAAAEQAAILVDGGVDALILETYLAEPAAHVFSELRAAMPDAPPILVSLREWPSGRSDLERAARRLLDLGASVLGINCQPDIDSAVAFAEKISRIVSCPLLVKPGVYPCGATGCDPTDFGAAVPALLASNVRLLGGCCGTTDRHVAALAASCSLHHQARPFFFQIGADR
jgi:5-methyltetrahydrofolate--homocysteine methyltransferase